MYPVTFQDLSGVYSGIHVAVMSFPSINLLYKAVRRWWGKLCRHSWREQNATSHALITMEMVLNLQQ